MTIQNKTLCCSFDWADWAKLAVLITEQNSRVVSGLLLLADECPYIRNSLRHPSLHLLQQSRNEIAARLLCFTRSLGVTNMLLFWLTN